jgi:hypothetical protein
MPTACTASRIASILSIEGAALIRSIAAMSQSMSSDHLSARHLGRDEYPRAVRQRWLDGNYSPVWISLSEK